MPTPTSRLTRTLTAACAAALLLAAGCGDERSSPRTSPGAAGKAAPATTNAEPTISVPAAEPDAPLAARAGEPADDFDPPAIRFRRGSGRPVGGLARSAYVVQAFQPMPAGFRRGGIPAGSRAGGCRLHAPSRVDLRQLRRLARAQHPRHELQGIHPENALLARCEGRGGYGIVVWTQIAPSRDRTTTLAEVRRRDGRWRERRGRRGVGCTLPRAAAAVFRIDVSPCRR